MMGFCPFSTKLTCFQQNSSLCFTFAERWLASNRSSHQRCSVKEGVLRNFAKFTGKLQAPPATLLKKRLWHRCFPVNFAKFLRTPFSQNRSGRLLLEGLTDTPQKVARFEMVINGSSCT